MLVCHCAVVSDRRIRQVIADGAEDLLDIEASCGAGSFCGGCVPALASLLAEVSDRSSSELLENPPTTVGATRPARKPAQTVVRAIEEDIAAAGWPVGKPLGTSAELRARYQCGPGTMRQALWVLEHHGMVLPGPDGTVLTGAPSLSAVAEAALLHLIAVGAAVGEIDDVLAVVTEHAAELAETASARGQQVRDRLLRPRATDAPEGPGLATGFEAEITELTGNNALGAILAVTTRVQQELADTDGPARERDAGRAAVAVTHALARELAADRRVGRELGTEEELTRRFGCDRSTFREATSLLEYYSIVNRLPGPEGRLVVALPDAWPPAQLFAMYLDHADTRSSRIFVAREPLERRAVELASTRLDEAGARRLQARLDEETTARAREIMRGDPLRASVYHNIHPILASLSGNRVITLLANALSVAIMRRASRQEVLHGRITEGADEAQRAHEAIVAAVLDGDAPRARGAMDRHLRGWDTLPPESEAS